MADAQGSWAHSVDEKVLLFKHFKKLSHFLWEISKD